MKLANKEFLHAAKLKPLSKTTSAKNMKKSSDHDGRK
jgi:hypothetical protein